MLTVLMIDDDEELAATVRDAAGSRLDELNFVIESDFSNAERAVNNCRPDVLILDMYRGQPTEHDVAGQEVWASLWAHRFCPVVVYTAGFEGLDPEIPDGHPFIRYLEKGLGSDQVVVDHLEAFAPTASALRAAESEVERVFQSVLQSVAEFVFENADNEATRTDLIVRAARRRVAAMMDEASDNHRGLLGWEQYLLPPIGDGLLMGDLIQSVGSSNDEPTAYGVVLTPSCDIQPGRCKVSNVLVGKCTKSSDYVTRGVGIKNATKARQRLPIALNDAHASGFVLLPRLPGRFPAMTLNMRDLLLVPPEKIGEVGDDDKEFVRVVSVDSPFREQLAWGYLQMAGRPGMPDREHATTVDDLIQDMQAEDG